MDELKKNNEESEINDSQDTHKNSRSCKTFTTIKNIALSVLIYAVFYIMVMAINSDAFRTIDIPGTVWVILGVLVTILYIVVIMIMVTIIAKLKMKWWTELIFAAISLIGLILINPQFLTFYVLWKNNVPLNTIISEMSFVEVTLSQQLLIPLFLIFSGTFFGVLLKRIIREVNLVFPVAIVVSLIDIWGVYFGFVDKVAESAPGVITGMASAETVVAQPAPPEAISHLPAPVQTLAAITPPETIGIGDFIFLAFFMALAVNYSMSIRKSVIGMTIGVFLASLVFVLFHNISYLPGLPFIAGGFILANLKEWKKLTKDEWVMTAVISGVIIVGIIISAIMSRS